MATILPIPPVGVPFLDENYNVNEPWRRYLLSIETAVGTGFAPVDARYVVGTSDGALTNEINLGILTTGYLFSTQVLGTANLSTQAAIPGGSVTGAALSAVDDVNVTLSLGGSPGTALLRATSLTLGWQGQLTGARGGTGRDTSGVTDGQLLIGKTSDHTLNLASLTAGSGITITPGAASLSIASISTGEFDSRATNGSVQAVADATLTALTFDTNLYDTGGVHEGVTHPTRFTVPTGAGNRLWAVGGQVTFNTTTAGRFACYVKKNGTTFLGGPDLTLPAQVSLVTVPVAIQDRPADGDYYEVFGYQATGGSVNTIAGNAATYGCAARCL